MPNAKNYYFWEKKLWVFFPYSFSHWNILTFKTNNNINNHYNNCFLIPKKRNNYGNLVWFKKHRTRNLKYSLSRLQRKWTSPPCISSDAISQTVLRSQGSEMLLYVAHLRVMVLHPEWVWQPISSETSSYKPHLFACPFVIYLMVRQTFLSTFSWIQICESSHKATNKLAYFEFIPSTCLFTQEASKAHIWPPGIKISWEVKPC